MTFRQILATYFPNAVAQTQKEKDMRSENYGTIIARDMLNKIAQDLQYGNDNKKRRGT